MKCKDCKYYQYQDKSLFENKPNTAQEIGYCHRYPPIHNCDDNVSMLIELDSFPFIEEDNWCGEFEQKGDNA